MTVAPRIPDARLVGARESLPQVESMLPRMLSRLHVVLQDRAGEALGVLEHLLNLRRSQKVRTSRPIPHALRQPLDETRCLSKGGVRLLRLAPRLIQRTQRRLDLPLFSRQ